MKRVFLWGIGVLVVAGLSIGGFVLLTGENGPLAAPISAQTTAQMETVAIRPAASILGQISASGSIVPMKTEHVVLTVDGTVLEVLVDAGDVVQAGDALLRLDTGDLERSALLAELDVATAQNSLDQLRQPASATELAEARADLASTEQKLIDAQKPAAQAETTAARASVASAWAKYNDLQAGPSAAELVKLEANLRKAEVAMQEAQRDYDKVKWAGDAGMTAQGAALQKATIDYEAAKADYEVSVAAAAQTDLQSAVSQANDAQQKLDDLLARPNAADIASAEAQVAAAQTRLDNLLNGADDLEIEAATIKLQAALVSLGEARKQLAKANVSATVAGSVLTVNVQEGSQARTGEEVATLADLSQLELTVNVAEVDINKVAVGQATEISVDALPGSTLSGEVVRIGPVNSGGAGAVSYAVTIALDGDLSGVLPDMTAVARFVDAALADGWLAPTTSIQRVGEAATLSVVREGVVTQVPVTAGAVQGEWTVVYADELQAGDQVVGSVRAADSSQQNEQDTMMERSPGGGAPPNPFGGGNP
ncbi:MAG: efflux RND transporter periplasmic adaptor subunit [Anaerolineales bacterium]|nr:efflux RND transporter periplasmic adaptor subunit [Anaerolineales bacterium]